MKNLLLMIAIMSLNCLVGAQIRQLYEPARIKELGIKEITEFQYSYLDPEVKYRVRSMKFDRDGLVIEESEYISAGRELIKRHIYEYDEKSIKKLSYTTDGDLYGEEEDIYSGKERISKIIFKNHNYEKDARKWEYFEIFASVEDDSIFVMFQDDLLIDPKLDRYTVVVNISHSNPMDHWVGIGDQASPDFVRVPWTQLSWKVQNGFINWSRPNKEPVYGYMQFSKIMFEYGTNNNLLKKNYYYMGENNLDSEEFKYTDGLLTESIYYYGSNHRYVGVGQQIGKTKSMYDKNGKVVNSFGFDDNDSVTWRGLYEYNEVGDVVVQKSERGEYSYTLKYEHKYDKNKMLTQTSESYNNGKFYPTKYYEFRYY